MNAINPWLFRKLPHDPIKDFAPITQRARIPNVPVMGAETARRLKITTLKDFIACAKAHPARLSYASAGNGSGGHLGRQHPAGQVIPLAVTTPQRCAPACIASGCNGFVAMT